jgi:hypothetical protein
MMALAAYQGIGTSQIYFCITAWQNSGGFLAAASVLLDPHLSAMFLQRQKLRFHPAVRAKADVSGVSSSATSSRFLSWFFHSSELLHQLTSPAECTKPANYYALGVGASFISCLIPIN